jgi:arylsulfatase A-like enzyme
MKSKYFITSLLLSSFGFVQAVHPVLPNILYIVDDDIGYGDVGFHRCKDIPHKALYWRFGQQMAIRQGDFKLVRYDSNADTNLGVRQPVSATKLYNLREDIGESRDLTDAMPEKVKELQTQWDAWNATLVKPLWGEGSGDSDGAEPGAPRKLKKRK